MPVTVLVRSGGPPRGERSSSPTPSITLDAPLIVIGRGEQCDVRLPDPSVSHRHATIRERGSERVLVDEGSVNGTFLGGFRMGTQAPRVLHHGDLVRLGRVWIEIRFDRAVPVTQPAMATKELALALVARAFATHGEAGGPSLRVVAGPDDGKELAIAEPGRVYVVGRNSDVDLVLSDNDVSRRHLQLVRRAEHLLVRDLGSKNGSYLGDDRLFVDRDRLWRAGEQIRLGGTSLVYDHRAAEALVELERAVDEVIPPDEPVAPPEPLAEAPATPAQGPSGDPSVRDEPGAGVPPTGPGGTAPGERAPERLGGAPRTGARTGWGTTDMMVVLLAVGVLGLSIVGLIWLFRG